MDNGVKDVLILIVSRGIGGRERRFGTLFRYLAEAYPQARVHFLVSRAQKQLIQSYTSATTDGLRLSTFGLPVAPHPLLELPFRYLDYVFLLLALGWRRLRGVRYDVAHFVTMSALAFRGWVSAPRKVYSLVSSHATRQVLGMKAFRIAAMEGIQVDCLSVALQSQAVGSGIVAPEAVHAAPGSFVDYSRTGVDDKAQIVTFSGRFVEGKGLELLMAALPQLLRESPDLHVQLMGHGELEGLIRETVREHGIEGRVSIGFHDEPERALRTSLIFLSLQERENYPSQALIEAMACGNAVVATDVGMTRELVDEQVGILISPDVDELAAAVRTLLQDIEATKAMGQRARTRVIERHTAARYWDYLLRDVYAL